MCGRGGGGGRYDVGYCVAGKVRGACVLDLGCVGVILYVTVSVFNVFNLI